MVGVLQILWARLVRRKLMYTRACARAVRCPKCTRKFTSKAECRLHIERAHQAGVLFEKVWKFDTKQGKTKDSQTAGAPKSDKDSIELLTPKNNRSKKAEKSRAMQSRLANRVNR
eukprot:234901_1